MVLHMHRKVIACLTGLMLLFGTMPAFVWAEETDETVASEPAKVVTETQAKAETQEEGSEEATEPETETAADCDTQNAEPAENEKEESKISVTVSIKDMASDETEAIIWIDKLKFEIDQDATAEDLLKCVKDQCGIAYDLDENHVIKSIKGPKDSAFSSDTLAVNKDEGEYWVITVNGKKQDQDLPVNKLELKKSVHILFSFEKGATQPEAIDEQVLDGEMLDEVVKAAATEKEVAFSYGNTKDYLTDAADKDNWSLDQQWTVIGNARAGMLTDGQKQQFYDNVTTYVNDKGSATLSPNQSSDNSKLILALTAIGEDPTDVSGYNLLEPLANFNYLTAQGMNGPLWALIAFDSGNYEIPKTTAGRQVTRENLVSFLLKAQHADGGWSYSGGSDIDMTSMVIQGLAPYYNSNEDVKKAVDKALLWLSSHQNKKGEFTTGTVSSESQSQVIVALTSLGIDLDNDTRFKKNGKSALDALLSFYVDGGGFKHIDSNWKANHLASVQGNYALVAYYRFKDGKNSLYDMSDNGDGYVIDIDYDEDDKEPKKDDDQNKENEDPAASGSTKALGLLKLKGADAKQVNACIEAIKKVLARNLSEDADAYSDDDMNAIKNAYKLYADLNDAGRLAVRKDKAWKPFEKITTAVGKAYHYDEPTGVDLRDNPEETLPWYVRLVVEEASFTEEQESNILTLLGEGSKIFYSYNVTLVDTLNDNTKWEPEKIVNASFEVPSEQDLKNTTIIHIGEKDRLEFVKGELNEDGSIISIKATSFSIYGLAGTQENIAQMLQPVASNDEPQTNNFLWILALIAALALILLSILIAYRAKNRREQDV